jgi:hypothetical protein
MILKGMKGPKFDTPLHLHIQYIVSYTETDEILLLLSSFPHYYAYMGVYIIITLLLPLQKCCCAFEFIKNSWFQFFKIISESENRWLYPLKTMRIKELPSPGYFKPLKESSIVFF